MVKHQLSQRSFERMPIGVFETLEQRRRETATHRRNDRRRDGRLLRTAGLVHGEQATEAGRVEKHAERRRNNVGDVGARRA